MRAIVYTETGSPSVLTEVERDVVDPAAGEVRVRLIVAGVNPTDWKSRTGAGPGRRPAFDEVVPGQDGAGIVDAVGPEVGGIAVGDRVWLILAQHERPTGTAQEYTVVPADRVALLPDNADFDLGASLGVPAVTAHRALTVAEDGPRRLHPGALDGTVVLVAGGAGAVGHAAIQLARWSGATVITTVSSSEKAALATAAGAHHVVNYRSDDAAARIREIAPDGVDIIVEVAPAQNAELNLAVASQRATISVYANNGGTAMTIEVRPHMVGNVRYQFLLLYTVGSAALDAAKNDVTEAVRAGALPVGEAHGLPLHRFPLVETARAHEAVESEVVGKVLIDIGTA